MWALVLGRGGFEPPKALGQLIYSQSRLTASVSARPRDFTDNRPMVKLRWILWQALTTPGMERFIVSRSNNGFEFSGLILQAHLDAPYAVRYRNRGRCRLAYPQGRGRARVVTIDEYASDPAAGPGARRHKALAAAWVRLPSLEVQRLVNMLH